MKNKMYFVFPSNVRPMGTRIALFDVDGTLIVSKSGRRIAADGDDWVFAHTNIAAHLHSLHNAGWHVALVSNQSEWTKSDAPKHKLTSLLNTLQTINGWTPWCLVATATLKEKDTMYRKPARGLYNVLLKELNIQPTEVTMYGDAVGADDPNPAYRWASSDREFARGIGATFARPCDVFNPVALTAMPPTMQELVILVGNPGSGKTTTGRSLAAVGYTHVEQDTLKNKSETLKVVKAALADGKSVVVDATHGSATNREPYITLAKTLGIQCKIVWHVRDGRPYNALRPKPVPEVAYAVYSKHFTDPRLHNVPVTTM